ncbi:pyridoxal-dependent decarboxylase [Archangium lipolyticum]|uniref:pyridoxal-dependent decarboxylase n=1 Tax=Archangium lipolyticum TaxID=2970465 RepID=UPI002149DC21|nr:pyridoxal-dependent decarboxylase [Archangium lipolyticum]
MSSSIHVLEHLFSAEGFTPEQRRLWLVLLEKLLVPASVAQDSAVLAGKWGQVNALDDGRRVDPRELPVKGESLDAVVDQLLFLMKGASSGVNLPGLLGAVSEVIARGGGERRDEGLLADEARSRVVAMVTRVVGYDAERSQGLTVWGARAAVLAGLRMAIARQAPTSRRKGVPRNLYCFASEAGHESLIEAVETTGIGGYHLIRVKTRKDGAMDPADLHEKMRAVAAGGDVPAFVMATTGSEGASALDDLQELREVADTLTTRHGLRPVHLHADAAWGGLYGVFNSYDFESNPLGFEPLVLEALALIRTRVRHLHLADSVGLDFRWLGRASYPAGLFLLRDGVDLHSVGLRTLETGGALALHAQLRALGLDGHRRLLADVLRSERAIRRGLGLDLSGVAASAETWHRGGAERVTSPSPGLPLDAMSFSGARAPLVRPRN